MRITIALALGTLLLTACGADNPPPPAAATTPTPAPVAAAPVVAAPVATAPTAAGHLWFEPAGLRICENKTPQMVTVFWDARGLPGKGPVELVAIGGKGKEVSFAVVGRVGKKDTGPWMFPGSTVVMRSKADGSELVRAQVGKIACE